MVCMNGNLLAASLARVEAGIAGEATALGDALALAVKRVSGAGGSPLGKLVVLLTDGRSNAGAFRQFTERQQVARFHRRQIST